MKHLCNGKSILKCKIFSLFREKREVSHRKCFAYNKSTPVFELQFAELPALEVLRNISGNFQNSQMP
jgi:hypothetical protein